MEDVRWKQRFSNFKKALKQLQSAVKLGSQRELSDLEKQGLIQGFEYVHELAWNTLKDYLEYQGPSNIKGSRDATREAFKRGIIVDGDSWMNMIRGRNLTSHTYNKESAEDLVEEVSSKYILLFEALESELAEYEKLED